LGGGWVVLSKGKLFKLTADGKLTPFTEGSYPDAYSVGSDQQGNIYLSVRGADQNVKMFSVEGKLIKEIGLKGGRPNNGPYNPDAMRDPGQVAIDSQNRLWVTEETKNPKRTSVWDIGSGKLVKDLVGTTSYAGSGSINPFDLTMGFADDTVYKIDLAKGTSKPTYSVGTSDNPNDLFMPTTHCITSRIIQYKGKTFFYVMYGNGRGAAEVNCSIYDGKRWRSVSHVGIVPKAPPKQIAAEKYYVGAFEKYTNALFAGKEGQLYTWIDANGDGLVQKEELAFWNPTLDGKLIDLVNPYWGSLPDVDGTVIFGTRDVNALVKLPIQEINSVGAPVYDINKLHIVRVNQKVSIKEGSMMGGSEGRVYINQSPLIGMDKNGNVLGSYPNTVPGVHGSHNATSAKPGYLIGPSSILGTAMVGGDVGEVFYLNGNLGQNFIFTQDCLWVQSMFKDTRGAFEFPLHADRGISMDGTTAGSESFGGNFIKGMDGKFYLVLGATDARVMEITGLDTIRRFTGEFTYAPEQYAEAQKQLQEKAAKNLEIKEYAIARAASVPVLDVKVSNWPELMDFDSTKAISVQESAQQRYGRAAMRWDEQNLYVAWRVLGNQPKPRNVGQDWRLLFKTGDVVDVMLGLEKDRKKDLRLLVAFPADKPVAVLNQKIAENATPDERYEFTAPWHKIVFDRVALASDVKVTMQSLGPNQYIVQAVIPWKQLGIEPKSGLVLKGDIGFLSADISGTITIARRYWSNKATGLVSDIPGEGDLVPKLWGTFKLE